MVSERFNVSLRSFFGWVSPGFNLSPQPIPLMKRRSFLSTSAVATFGFQFVPAHVVRAQEGAKTPNNKVRLAVIGCGGQGGADLGGMADEDIVALCDVDDRRAADMLA